MIDEIRIILTDSLKLGERGKRLLPESRLIGELPELDSMAVISVVTALEDHYDIEFEDDELSAESFETLGSLCSLVELKMIGQ